jgi:hypothetical protein
VIARACLCQRKRPDYTDVWSYETRFKDARLSSPPIRADSRGAHRRSAPARSELHNPAMRVPRTGVRGRAMRCQAIKPYGRTTIPAAEGASGRSALHVASSFRTRRFPDSWYPAPPDVNAPRPVLRLVVLAGFCFHMTGAPGAGTRGRSRFRMGILRVSSGSTRSRSHASIGPCRERICVTGVVLDRTTSRTGHRHWRLEQLSQSIGARRGPRGRLVLARALAGWGRGRRVPWLGTGQRRR